MSERIWMAVSTNRSATRLLATAGPGDTLLKARLSPCPGHERALARLLEAVALWQGQAIHAVHSVDADWPLCGRTSFGGALGYEHTPLYTLEPVLVSPRSRREITGLGDFRDLHRLLHREVAR